MLNRLTVEAEAWAEAGTPKVQQVELRREPSPHRPQRTAGWSVGDPSLPTRPVDAPRRAA
jgi:hypothetical protein